MAARQAMNRQDPGLSPEDRSGLIDDAFALANAGLLPITQGLNNTRFLKNELLCTLSLAACCFDS